MSQPGHARRPSLLSSLSSPTTARWKHLLLCGVASGALSCTGTIEGGGSGITPGPGAGPGSSGGANPGDKPGGNSSGPPGAMTTPPVGNDPVKDPPMSGACAPGPARIWALTPTQYVRTVRALLPTSTGIGDNLGATLAEGTGFSNDAARLGMTEPHVSELLDTVWQLATKATTDLGQLAPCLAGAATADDACVRGFVTQFGTRAFRRDLAADEVTEMTAYVRKQSEGGDTKAGLRRFLLYLFTSPNFVYRTELGPESAASGAKVSLTPFERAQTLSYYLTDGPPDPELFAAAKSGGLATAAEIESHTRRMLAKPENATGFSKLFRELFETSAPRTTDKDGEVFPDWKEALAGDLTRESDAFLQQVLWGEDGKFSTLLTADFSMLNGALAGFYGLTGTGADFTKIKHKPGQRAGILTQAGRMAALAKNNDTDAVARGRFVREVLLCQPLPPPPDTVNAVPPPPDGKRTQRERLLQHSANQSCAGCHTLMDPLGLAFENYDGIGRYRTVDVGQAIDASGKLTQAQPEGASFKDAVELMRLLGSSPTAGRCFVATAFRYAHGRDVAASDSCTIDRLAARFDASGGNMLDLAVAITTDEGFFVRQAR